MSKILSRARPDVLAMKGYSSARSLYKKQSNMIFLDANECAYEPFIGAQNLSRYADQQPAALVDVICRLYDVSSRNLMIGRGADEAIDILIRTFCEPRTDNIIICPPTFAMYEHSAAIQGADVKRVPLTNTFDLDVSGIQNAADTFTKVVFICSPNNPTGNVMRVQDIEALCDYFCDRALVVVDETYMEYAGEEHSVLSLIETYPNLIVTRTLSKSYAAAGVRCGFAMGHSDVIALLLKILPPYPIPVPVVDTVLNILSPNNIQTLETKRADIIARREGYMKDFHEVDDVVKIYPSDANYILLQVQDADAFFKKCLNSHIIVRNQSHQLGLKNCVRISIGSEDQMAQLFDVLEGQKRDLEKLERKAEIVRKTKETSISVCINLDQPNPVHIDTGVPFYDHMIEQIAKHGGISIHMECEGDLDIEAHHTVEDCAIALGKAMRVALDDKRGIGRYGSHDLILPMDEAQATVALDLGGRFYLKFDADFPDAYVGNRDNPLPVDMVEHVFRSFAEALKATLHISVTGENTHHMVEASFKGLGRALRHAVRVEGDALPSTKGML